MRGHLAESCLSDCVQSPFAEGWFFIIFHRAACGMPLTMFGYAVLALYLPSHVHATWLFGRAEVPRDLVSELFTALDCARG